MKDSIKKSTVYLVECHNLNDRFNLLDGKQKKYAKYLVKRYGYKAGIAIQQVYFFGFDCWPYDYRSKKCVQETMAKSSFGY